jgi:hypothetical protein
MAGDLPRRHREQSCDGRCCDESHTVITVPLLVVSGRVVALRAEQGDELFEVEVNEKVDALAVELPQWREEGR